MVDVLESERNDIGRAITTEFAVVEHAHGSLGEERDAERCWTSLLAIQHLRCPSLHCRAPAPAPASDLLCEVQPRDLDLTLPAPLPRPN